MELWLVDCAACCDALEQLERAASGPGHDELFAAPNAPMQPRRTAYRALRLLIERMFGEHWRGTAFERRADGKPLLPGLDGDFSLSHSSDLALIGVSRLGAIGVDIETERQPKISADRRRRMIDAAMALRGEGAPGKPGKQRFIQSWVRLEACAKADGGGIGRLLTAFGIVGGGAWNAARDPVPERYRSLRAHDLDAGTGIYAAVALPAGLDAPTIRRLPAAADMLERLRSA